MLALTIAVCLSVSVFAAPSKSDVVELTIAVDENGEEVAYTVEETTIPLLSTVIAADECNEEGVETTAADLTVLWQKDITAEKLPVTLTFHVDGTDGIPLYVFHWNGSEWELITVGEGPDVEATFTSLSPVAVVADTTRPATDIESPKTGVAGSGTAVAAALCAGAACAVLVYAVRKKNS